nr:hypothetical protein [uncultured Mucilaginibacter sp.]
MRFLRQIKAAFNKVFLLLIEILKKGYLFLKGSTQYLQTLFSLSIVILTIIFCYEFDTSKLPHKIFRTTADCDLWLAISGFILIVFALIDDFSAQFRMTFWKATTLKLALIIIACNLGYMASTIKNKLSENALAAENRNSSSINKKRDRELRDTLKKINKSANDSLRARTKEIISDFGAVLSENSKYIITDQAQRISQLKDSIKKLSANKYSPEVYIDTILLKELPFDTRRFTMRFKNDKDIAYSVKIKYYFLVREGMTYKPVSNSYTLITMPQLSSSKPKEMIHDFFKVSNFKLDYYFIYFSGEYFDSQKNRHPINDIYRINLKTKKVDLPTGFNYDFVLDEFHKAYNDTKYW